MIILAGAFLTFLGFLFAGLLALAITALLDRSMGKERALLLWTGVLLLFTLWQCTPDAIRVRAKPKPEKTVPADLVDVKGDPFARPDIVDGPEARNPFQKHSDTRPLPPVVLDPPPWPALAFSLPPTVPGPAPGARRLLRGPIPESKPGDGSTLAEIPDPVFADYVPTVDDVYDAIVKGGRKSYVYILAIRQEGTWTKEGDPRFEALKWALVHRSPGWEQLDVEGALIGSREAAEKKIEPTAVLKARHQNRSTVRADQFDAWILRATVANLYHEVLRRRGLARDLESSTDIAGLRAAAEDMAEIGRTGKENRAGWRHAAHLLELALAQARTHASPGLRADVLRELVAAYGALRDEQAMLRALAEYARISPSRPEPWLRLGEVYLERLDLPGEALAFFRAAIERAPREAAAWRGLGDALSALGRHEEALDAYRKGGGGYEGLVRVAEAQLRLGDLAGAGQAAEAALRAQEEGPRGLLVLGAILYTRGDLETARETFQRAAMTTGGQALQYRAQAAYGLGLTAWRLGQADAALAAFEATAEALRFGSQPGRSGDETVSPAFGRALVALGAGQNGEFLTEMQTAQEEAPRVAYRDALQGMVAAKEGNAATAVRSFDHALRLTDSYPELDGWLARTRLDLGLQALAAGTPIEEATPDFRAAVAFAARASGHERRIDKSAFEAQLRECWIRMHAMDEPARQRYQGARKVASDVLQRIDREQPAALTLRGYANYHLAHFGAVDSVSEDPYDVCIRDLQQVLDKVPVDSEGPWRPWRDYAASTLAAIKHWRSLEEKTVRFDGTSFPSDWKTNQSQGVKTRIEGGVIYVQGIAKSDGSIADPIFKLSNEKLFTVGSFEEVRLMLRIPPRGREGTATNTITFGVQVQRSGSSRGGFAKQAGIGVFYDRGKEAARIGGGREERFKDGMVHRTVPEKPWPSDGWVEVRIVRQDLKTGTLAAYVDKDPADGLDGEKIVEDIIGSYKGKTRAKAQLWIGGWSTEAQEFDVQIKDIRVIRRKR